MFECTLLSALLLYTHTHREREREREGERERGRNLPISEYWFLVLIFIFRQKRPSCQTALNRALASCGVSSVSLWSMQSVSSGEHSPPAPGSHREELWW